MVKVSIIVPVYNVEQYLERCVCSLTGQTLREIEIILVDDGSPDQCPRLCDEFAACDQRIKVIHKKNEGLGFARNAGIAAATGEYIGFVDSDDYVAPQMYEKLYNAAKMHGAQLSMCGFCCVGGIMVSRENERQMINCFESETVFDGTADMNRLMLEICGARPHNPEDSKYGFSSVKNLYEASVLRDNDIRFLSEREVMSEDVFFLLDFLEKTTCAVGVEGAYYYYCRNGASLSKSYRADRFEKCQRMMAEMNRRLSARMPASVYQIYTDRLFQAYARAACMQEIMFAKDNGLSDKALRQRLRGICTSPALSEVLRRYPWYKLPILQALFAMTMRFSWLSLQIMLVKIKNRG